MIKYIRVRELTFRLSQEVSLERLCSNSLTARAIEVVVALATKEFEQRRPKLTSRKRSIFGHIRIYS